MPVWFQSAPAPAPGLDHDYGQITARDQPLYTVLLGVQVTDVRRGYCGGRRDQIMTMVRSRPDHNLCSAFRCSSHGRA